MAKYIAQIIIAGTQVIGRAFARAIKQEYEASQQAAQRLGNAKTRNERIANNKLGLSLDEAKQILNVSNLNKEEVEKRYEALFKANEKSSGGSFYLQSKVVRAKERIDMEMKNQEESPGKDKANKT
ncbi:mitochondrial import inner membrane translocase subunit TIM16 [Tribolium castaneum]|uniref:Mitochondrial import inner membrane translocase subunit Tim16-like Protein n=1 Tax=Tribolium castaneum TaxID=7070 RepID=D2A3Y8_TRICA|nr:PREDICTED: mitochondrial import inner membrane translocase subunit TIM16 [Tribolium castaneum]EFA05583.1 Mitochondrial import inner membrane translocase subunit Tim16-like Protein [Tribolium castaneum]|eukprot:XP_971695.1 PREDICTED: mitochondrial import inner membrane translocase subunit TIM16 [Tribolium castaneum]